MEKGSIGYMSHVKSKNLKLAVFGLGAMIVLYFTGLILVGSNGSTWTLLAVLLALPAAQFLSRYLSLRHYKSLTPSDYRSMDHLSAQGIAYELALVVEKKTYYLEALVITSQEIVLLSTQSGITPKIVMDLLKLKGVICQVQVCKDFDTFYDKVQALQTSDQDNIKTIRDVFINNAL